MSFFGMGMQELLVIFLICLLVFGASRLPEIGRAFGKTVNEFKKGMKESLSDETVEVKETSDTKHN